jgi:hypothetical protein
LAARIPQAPDVDKHRSGGIRDAGSRVHPVVKHECPAATEPAADANKEHYDISIWFRMHPSDALTDIPPEGYATDHWYEDKST